MFFQLMSCNDGITKPIDSTLQCLYSVIKAFQSKRVLLLPRCRSLGGERLSVQFCHFFLIHGGGEYPCDERIQVS